jgi:membrane protein implicated in regulation of membrane protease activity
VLDLGIDLDVWPWIWLTVAVVFALIELILIGGSFVLLPFAVSAFAAAILAFYDVAVEVQWGVFALGGAALFFVLYRWSRRFLADHLLPPGVGADRLVGLVGIVTVGISPDDPRRSGRVAVSGEVWGAIASADRTLTEGMKVRITAMEGTRVVVEPVPPPQGDVSGGEHQ